MNYYEAVIIFDSDSPAEVTKAEIKKFKDMLQDWSKPKKVDTNDMGVKQLAYDIKKHTHGYYVMFTFQSIPDNIPELERQLRIDDHVLKFMTLKIDEDSMEKDLEDYIPNDEEPLKCEQDHPQPDALDVLLGFAKYKKKGVN